MKELKNIYDKIEPDTTLVEQTKRKMRATVPYKRQTGWRIVKLVPALCLFAVCILIFALPDMQKPVPSDTGSTSEVTLAAYSNDELYDEMLELSGGMAFSKVEAYVSQTKAGEYNLEIITVDRADSAPVKTGETVTAKIADDLTVCQENSPTGQVCTIWLYADSSGSWNIYGIVKGNDK